MDTVSWRKIALPNSPTDFSVTVFVGRIWGRQKRVVELDTLTTWNKMSCVHHVAISTPIRLAVRLKNVTRCFWDQIPKAGIRWTVAKMITVKSASFHNATQAATHNFTHYRSFTFNLWHFDTSWKWGETVCLRVWFPTWVINLITEFNGSRFNFQCW